MKRHVALAVLAVTAAVVIDLHVDWRRADNGVLLRLGEQDIDVWGHTREAWNRFTRRCGRVQELRADDPAWDAAQAAVRAYSPPDSQTARVVAMSRQGDWLLAQVVSDTLMPAVVALHTAQGRIALVPQGIWSGSTTPWLAAPWIRDYLSRQAPALPQPLVDCLEIAPDSPLQRPLPPPARPKDGP
ncbi:MAG: hypothetical protein RL522_1979 [Pseudomonadota bacterium]|jgi:hypothetical protein